MHIDPRNILILVLLGFLTWQLVDNRAQASTDGGGDANRSLIAVTGQYGSGASALYLVDTKTRHMAVYRLRNGRHLEFVAARDCMYDFFLETYNDLTPAELMPKALRRGWQEINRRSEPLTSREDSGPGSEKKTEKKRKDR